MEWQPIETAPKDGTWFLAFWPTKVVQDQVRTTQWLDDADESCFVDSSDSYDWMQPTHWMPLPAPPEEK